LNTNGIIKKIVDHMAIFSPNLLQDHANDNKD